jgi:hypothetical protein
MRRRTTIARYLQYFYFLRVSVLFWLFLPVLCGCDLARITASLTRGIFTLYLPWQWFWATFFVVATNMAVLITARNIVNHGRARFRATPPDRIYRLLTDTTPRTIWKVFAVVHVFTATTIVYLMYTAHREGESLHPMYILAGFLAALCFWYLVSLFYYWSYRSPMAGTVQECTRTEPAALIFPNYDWLFGDITIAEPPPRLLRGIKCITDWFLRTVSCAGYAATTEGAVWELHFLSGLSLAGIFIVYLFLYPLTSPVFRSATASYGQMLFCAFVTYLFLWSIEYAGVAGRWGRPVKRLFVVVAMSLALLFITALAYDMHTRSVRLNFSFPALASILVLLGFLLWFLAGVTFFLDRYRIPVLTLFLSFIFLPKLFFAYGSECLLNLGWPRVAEIFDSDHYFPVVSQKTPIDIKLVPTPSEAFKTRIQDGQPYVIITASGGGIQAAEWTAQVMANLEKQFDDDPRMREYKFHDHILFASGVSGGADGLMPFILEYTAQPNSSFPNTPALWDRITGPPGCSSLEAVGWGLSYHDFYRLILPLSPPRALIDGAAPDRSWALASAFNRNLHDRQCSTEHGKPNAASMDLMTLPKILDGEAVTLNSAAKLLAAKRMPAFTFNTTAAETGGRFLLSNYYVPQDASCVTDFTPAESFLQVYGADPRGYAPAASSCHHGPLAPLAYADLQLATAARLSATFPLVSSGTRIPLGYSRRGDHFLDGGYFDNDGTSSAIEFLKSALEDRSKEPPPIPQRILWIEIRDDDGAGVGADVDDLASQNEGFGKDSSRASSWTPLGQLLGIAEGLWNAGHKSISRRNRRELCTFELAYHLRIPDLHHIVFTIYPSPDKVSPLSWNLTKSQRDWIRTEAINRSGWITKQAIDWVASNPDFTKEPLPIGCISETEPETWPPPK